MTKGARIMAVLRAEGVPITSLDVADELGDQVHKVNALLRQLELAGRAQRCGQVYIGGGRKPFNLWRPRPPLTVCQSEPTP